MSSPANVDREFRRSQLEKCILAGVQRHSVNGNRWFDWLMKQLMHDASMRVQMLRFVDVYPTLTTDSDLLRHLIEYFDAPGLETPALLKWGIRDTKIIRPFVSLLVRRLLVQISTRFMGGVDADSAVATIRRLRESQLGFSLDLLGESVLGEEEAEHYQQAYFRFIDEIAPLVSNWKSIPMLDRIDGKCAPKFYISLKLTSIFSQISPVNYIVSVEAIATRLKPILLRAKCCNVFVCIDMEQYQYKDIVLAAVKQVLMDKELRDWSFVGLAMQAYLKETEKDLVELIDWLGNRGAPISVRLVRGAYWDYETVICAQQGWPCPVWLQKSQTDANYHRCLKLLLSNHPVVRTAVATHNLGSIATAITVSEELGLTVDQYEFQMLYGMAKPLQTTLSEMGYCLRIYVPFGDPVPGMAYLVRRMLENSSSQVFFTQGLGIQKSEMFVQAASDTSVRQGNNDLAPVQKEPVDSVGLSTPFNNEPLHRFITEQERLLFSRAIEKVRKSLGGFYPLLINTRTIETKTTFTSLNPATDNYIVGVVAQAENCHAQMAISAAASCLDDWAGLTMEQRSIYLLKTAELLRKKRDIFSAWEVFEAGKTWVEADANVCEAIDFLTFYAKAAMKLGDTKLINVPGELNQCEISPLGVGVIISPWNFPLAILTGMVAAAIVTGNTVILKPSTQTPVIASLFVNLLSEAGLPENVVQFLPGSGLDIGEYLVSNPAVHFIAFTGSESVGLRIMRLAARRDNSQTHIKRVVAEMGGKNIIIVDSDADLDEAVSGIVSSAYGYQGQKCSACSRVIVIGGHYRELIKRLKDATRSLHIGAPENPSVKLGPVISAAAQDRIFKMIESGKKTARLELAIDCHTLAEGNFVGPTIFSDAQADSELLSREIFGPVLSIQKVDSLDFALSAANSSRYALTGGFFSRSPKNILTVKRGFEVGNLYINRGITGALVGRQPFGGYKMSGLGTKAGCADYLFQFVHTRIATENTMRGGFAP